MRHAAAPSDRAVAAAPVGGAPADPDNYVDIARGKALATAGDCVACHTASGGQPFAGGLALQTPFGAIMTPNITPDNRDRHRQLVDGRFRARDA